MSGVLAGKVVFVTGAGRGQGRAHAVTFAEQGANVIGIDICAPMPYVDYPLSSPDDLAETVRQVEAAGGRMVSRVADVRDAKAVGEAVDDGVAAFGRLDFVLANAGVMPMSGELANQMGAWQSCLDVIMTGTLNTLEATYPRLVEQGEGGSIVITSSMAATGPMMRTEDAKSLGLLGYSASKLALVSLCQNYASFLAPHRIRVNAVQPTGVDTPMVGNDMVQNYFATSHPEDLLVLVNALPVEMLAPRDVSELMLWLCSDASTYFTGNAVRLDGGASLR